MPKIKQSVKKTGKARKELIVAELVEKIDNSNGLVFVDYKGLTHQQLENLKKELKALDSTIVIAKNSLLKLSLGKSKNFAEFKDNEGLELPTAALFIKGDMVEPLKKLQKTVKDLGLPKIKFAVLEGNLTDEAGVLKIAALPARNVLIAQFVGTLNSPIQGLVITLNATIQKFVMTLDAVAKSKPAAPAPAPEPTPAPATNETTPTETPTSSEGSESANQSADGTPEVPSDSAEEKVGAAASTNEPATQPDEPVTTDESADAGTESAPEEKKDNDETDEKEVK